MELHTVQLPESHRIALISDLHKGNSAHHRKGFQDAIERILREDDLYVAFGGDQQESILTDDPRFSHHVHDAKRFPIKVMHDLADELEPIAHKILFILTGNHELKLHRFGDLTEELCKKLKVRYGGYSTKLAVCDPSGSLRYKLYYTHGRLRVTSGADDPVRRLSNMRLAIKRKLHPLAGDCAVMATGHCHVLTHIDPESELYLTDDGHNIQAHYTAGIQAGSYIDPNLRWYVATGSLLKSYITGAITYSEAAMYAPNQLGYSEIIVENGIIKKVKDIHVGHHDPDIEETSNDSKSQEIKVESPEGRDSVHIDWLREDVCYDQ